MKSRLRAQLVVFTATRVVVNTFFRMVYPFLPAIGRGLGIDLQQLSLALTGRSLAGAFGPLLASLADSRGRKTGMLSGLALFVIGIALVVFWPTFWGLTIALILTALGKLAFDPSMQAYLGDRVPYERRGLALAITELGWSGAFLLGIPAMGFLISREGWLAPFPLLALLAALALGVLAWMLPRDPQREGGRPGLLQNLGTVLRSPAALAGLAMGFFIAASNEVVNLVLGVWMEDAFGLQVAALGAATAVIGVAELSGEGLVSLFADRLGKKRLIRIGLLAISLAALALPLLGRSLPGALVGLFFFYLSFETTFVSSIPLMSEVLPSARATLLAVNIAVISLGRALAALLAPTIYAAGFWASALAAMAINLLALLALRFVHVPGEP